MNNLKAKSTKFYIPMCAGAEEHDEFESMWVTLLKSQLCSKAATLAREGHPPDDQLGGARPAAGRSDIVHQGVANRPQSRKRLCRIPLAPCRAASRLLHT